MRSKSLIAILVCSTLVSCRNEKVFTLNPGDFQKAVPSGLRAIPQAQQMHEIFPPAAHSIRNLHEDQRTAEWQSTVLFGGRYILCMTVPVRMTDDLREVEKVSGVPEFELIELSQITNDGHVAMYDPHQIRRFSAEDWAKVYQARSDFQVIGMTLQRHEPPIQDFALYNYFTLRKPYKDEQTRIDSLRRQQSAGRAPEAKGRTPAVNSNATHPPSTP